MLDALFAYRQFIVWKAVQVDEEPKPVKVPISYVDGMKCDAHDATNWTTFEHAAAMAPLLGATGVGFVLTPGDPFCCIDLDHCLVDGQYTEFSRYIMSVFPDAATELSYSGDGLHLWFQYDPAQLPPNHRTRSKNVPGLEVYTSNRFVALGPRVFHGDASTQYGASLVQLVNYFLPGTTSAAMEWSDTPVPEWNGPEDDAELLAKMLDAKKSAASAFGGKASFRDLWEGNVDVLAGTYPSGTGDDFDHSAADAALMSHLAFWTGKNCARMDRLFRQSALMRSKYEDRPDYQHDSITKACGWTTAVYSASHLLDVSPSHDAKDILNARMFGNANRGRLLFIDETGDVLKFTDGGWILADIGDAENAAKDVVESYNKQAHALFMEDPDSQQAKALRQHASYSSTLQRIKAMIELAKSEPGMSVRLSDFDADSWMLGVQNGILDLCKGILQSVTPSMLVSKRANVIYDPKATCPLFETFLSTVQLDPNVRRLLQQLAGIWLCGKSSLQKLIFFYGLGANGKTTFIELLAWLLGDYAKVIATEMLMQHQRNPQGPSPDIVALKGRRLVYCSEIEEGRRLAEARVKELTGGDTLSGRVPYAKTDICFQPTHKLVMIGNHKPEVRGIDNGIWRRMLLIPFDQVIPAHAQDEELLDKLKQEGPGVLNWALAGLSDYRRNGLCIPAIISGATDAYRTDQDIIGEWILDHCNVIAGALTDKGTLYKAYSSWAKEHGHGALSQTKFTRQLTERGHRLDAGRRKCCGMELNPQGLHASTIATGVR